MSQDNLPSHVFVGRQPIYHANLDVYGYELLYRGRGDAPRAEIDNANLATSQVILNSYLEIGLDKLVGSRKAFINITRDFIDGSLALPLRAEQVVLEVLEDIAPDPEVIAGLEHLVQKGFKLALDDFVYHRALEPLIHLADLIKIDIQQMSRDALQQTTHQLKRRGIRLLAEKIETREEFEFCESLGFDYYQGYFLARPTNVGKKTLPGNKLVILQLLGRLQDPDVEFDDLRDLVSKDPSLSIKLLNYINSPVFGLSKPVASIHRALELLGLSTLKRWVTMLAIFGLGDKPSEVLRTAMVRAKLCELIAASLNYPNSDEFFVLGLFSLLDALLDMQLEEVLRIMHLSPDLTAALLSHEGVEGQVLAAVLAYEAADWNKVMSLVELSEAVLSQHYVTALAWAEESMVDV